MKGNGVTTIESVLAAKKIGGISLSKLKINSKKNLNWFSLE